MLSRVAQRMYWLGRHVERAENTARILDVNHRMSLELAYFSDLDVWSPMLAITRSKQCFETLYNDISEKNIYEFFLLSTENPNSVLSCIAKCREEARVMRERISEEMWEHLNRVYLEIQSITLQNVMGLKSSTFHLRIKMFCNAFHGLADNTMVHDQSWEFLLLGRLIERALMTSRILEIKYHLLLPDVNEVGKPLDLHQWQALLRSASAFEAYRHLYKAKIVPAQVIRLLLLNPHFPRSVHYCMRGIHAALCGIGASNEDQYGLYRSVEICLDDLRGGQIERQLTETSLKQNIERTMERCMEVDRQLHHCYFEMLSAIDESGQEHKMSVQQPQQ